MYYIELERDEFGYKSKIGLSSELIMYRNLINKLIKINKQNGNEIYLYIKGEEYKDENNYKQGTSVKYVVFDKDLNAIHYVDTLGNNIYQVLKLYINEKTDIMSYANNVILTKILLLNDGGVI